MGYSPWGRKESDRTGQLKTAQRITIWTLNSPYLVSSFFFSLHPLERKCFFIYNIHLHLKHHCHIYVTILHTIHLYLRSKKKSGIHSYILMMKFTCLSQDNHYLDLFLLIYWSRKWQTIPVFLPGKFHRQRNLAGYSPWGCKDMAE